MPNNYNHLINSYSIPVSQTFERKVSISLAPEVKVDLVIFYDSIFKGKAI